MKSASRSKSREPESASIFPFKADADATVSTTSTKSTVERKARVDMKDEKKSTKKPSLEKNEDVATAREETIVKKVESTNEKAPVKNQIETSFENKDNETSDALSQPQRKAKKVKKAVPKTDSTEDKPEKHEETGVSSPVVSFL